MKTHFFFLIFIVSAFLVFPVHAVTISGAAFYDNLTPGESISHTMKINGSTAESGITLSLSTSGNCAGWISLSTGSITLSTTPAPVVAVINVPSSGVYNDPYKCEVLFTAPANGFTQSQLEVPMHETITGGIPGPVPTTPAPAGSESGSAGTSITPQPTPINLGMLAPVQTTVQTPIETGTLSPGATISPAITQSTVPMQVTTTQPAGQPGPDMGTGIMVLAGIFVVVFAGVMIHDYKRGKK